eukprot:CAMPEP_0196657648 /NCGR_PEP_ID=MMETSP1086-20130531/24619_1 /TAXON_ID=77921 /ORGANISM="Cyanoptyche  gloeocystis , Strain SAG4.97" /LENGTH=202 /DNA_ID=CAMNT_0041990845 /DNA_START=32 /DNA_END=640 /DNA_ORIENTATION=+
MTSLTDSLHGSRYVPSESIRGTGTSLTSGGGLARYTTSYGIRGSLEATESQPGIGLAGKPTGAGGLSSSVRVGTESSAPVALTSAQFQYSVQAEQGLFAGQKASADADAAADETNDHCCLAIFSVLCFLPFGLFALFFARKVRAHKGQVSAYQQAGQLDLARSEYQKAADASSHAAGWSKVAIGTGVVAIIVVVVLILLFLV